MDADRRELSNARVRLGRTVSDLFLGREQIFILHPPVRGTIAMDFVEVFLAIRADVRDVQA